MIAEERLSDLIASNVKLRLVEPHLYSVYAPGENTNQYDRAFGTIYDVVACNRFYNRFVWGYSTTEYRSLCLEAFAASKEGWILDAGCGSLGFTATMYADYKARPVVLLDQSVKMLRMAKAKLIEMNGKVPSNMVFLHGNVLRLPFKSSCFRTLVSLNVLHVLGDIKNVLSELKRVLSDGGTLSLTTMILNNRCADNYLRILGRAGEVFTRNEKQLLAAFDEIGMTVKYRVKGNMAFVSCR